MLCCVTSELSFISRQGFDPPSSLRPLQFIVLTNPAGALSSVGITTFDVSMLCPVNLLGRTVILIYI